MPTTDHEPKEPPRDIAFKMQTKSITEAWAGYSFRDIVCIYIVRYEWDERKNRLNQRNHDGISFEIAVLVFDDEHRIISLDRVDETGEQRWHAIGAVSAEPGVGDVLLVVHAYREDNDGEERIRIISARKADDNEYRRYQEQEMD